MTEAQEVDTGADTYDPETDFRTEDSEAFEEFGGSDDEEDGF